MQKFTDMNLCIPQVLLMGGASIDVHGVPLTDEAIAIAKACRRST